MINLLNYIYKIICKVIVKCVQNLLMTVTVKTNMSKLFDWCWQRESTSFGGSVGCGPTQTDEIQPVSCEPRQTLQQGGSVEAAMCRLSSHRELFNKVGQ